MSPHSSTSVHHRTGSSGEREGVQTKVRCQKRMRIVAEYLVGCVIQRALSPSSSTEQSQASTSSTVPSDPNTAVLQVPEQGRSKRHIGVSTLTGVFNHAWKSLTE